MGQFLDKPQADPTIYTLAPLLQKSSQEQPNHALLLEAKALLLDMEELISSLQAYTPVSALIRTALTTPSDTSAQSAALQAVIPNITLIEKFHTLTTTSICPFFPKILSHLSGDNELANQPILAYKLTHLLQQIYKLDELKMGNPNLQNEFSFYRRSATKVSQGEGEDPLPISESKAGQISMWIANATPVAGGVCEVLKKEGQAEVENFGQVLVKCANMCTWISAKGGWVSIKDNVKFDGYNFDVKVNRDKQEELMFMAMAMCVVVVDRISKRGAFVKTSGIHLKKMLSVLNGGQGGQAEKAGEGGGREQGERNWSWAVRAEFVTAHSILGRLARQPLLMTCCPD